MAGRTPNEPKWDSTEIAHWSSAFTRVEIPAEDGALQPAMVRRASVSKPRPLMVSLHTWSAGYEQQDPFADVALARDWHYIHPHFQGPNRHSNACLSPRVISDVDDAIAWALREWNVDPEEITMVGVSGGGHVTCGMYLNTRHKVKEFHAWVPVIDIERWYQESTARKLVYAGEILQCVGTVANGELNVEEARRRSPIHMRIPDAPKGRLSIYAGIHDGYTGSVPVSHSIRFYNRLVDAWGKPSERVSAEEMIDLLSRAATPNPSHPAVRGRAVYLHRQSGPVSLTIFEGGHEGLPEIE
jgi:dienelactone hydrolase